MDDRLTRLLDAPSFARVVPHLAPETLHQLIRHRGLDASADVVTAATPAQLTSLLDLDLWRQPQPGRDERFDVERFGEWLEVLVDHDAAVAARTVAALDLHLVVAGLSRYVRPFDPGTFEPTESSDDEAMDRHEMMSSETSSDVLECELGGYLVRARRTDAWDAIVALLVALETEHHDYFHAVMQGCRRLSNSRPELNGFHDLLLAPEQHAYDTALERDERRSRHGYASPADARAFLHLARQPRPSPHRPSALAAAYFRAADERVDAAPERRSADATGRTPGDGDRDFPASVDAVIELLAEAGVVPERPRALLAAAAGEAAAPRLVLLQRLMEYALHHDDTAYLERSRELGFLANTLLAGASVQARPFTPQEASDAAACVCNLGLEHWPASADAFLVDHDLVTAFEVGWSVLYHDVSLFVAERLVVILADLRGVDAETRVGLLALRRTLEKHRQAGAPWLARPAADALAPLDMTAWISVLGLLDECPILPAALIAILEHRTTSVDPAAFEFISTTAQLGEIRLFMRALPGLLSN